MVEKRKRVSASSGTPASPSKKKIIIGPRYREMERCIVYRIKKHVPSDVKIINIKIGFDPKKKRSPRSVMKQVIEENTKAVRDEHKVGILVGVSVKEVEKDSAGKEKNVYPGQGHAMAVYRWGDVLYCFDSYGSSRENKYHGNEIFGIMKDVFGCKILKIYNGYNLQTYDKFGVCVGLASNFIMIMANRSTHLRQKFSTTIKESLIGLTMNAIKKNLQAKTLVLSKPRSSKSRAASKSSKSQSSKSQSSKSQSSKSSKSPSSSKSQSSKSTKSLTPMNINKPTMYMSTD